VTLEAVRRKLHGHFRKSMVRLGPESQTCHVNISLLAAAQERVLDLEEVLSLGASTMGLCGLLPMPGGDSRIQFEIVVCPPAKSKTRKERKILWIVLLIFAYVIWDFGLLFLGRQRHRSSTPMSVKASGAPSFRQEISLPCC